MLFLNFYLDDVESFFGRRDAVNNPPKQTPTMKKPLKTLTTTLLLTPLVLACFAFSQMARAEPDVSPPPDGGYPGFTTAEAQNALKNRTSGLGNSAFGWYSLFSVTSASYNTGLGAGTLALNTGEANTASGVAALILNTAGTRNTANGAGAMVFNSTGNDNSGVGYFSLYNNDTGDSNSAVGSDTLLSNVSGDCNVAVGESALIMNTTGSDNIAVGCGAGSQATTGNNNIYIGNIGVAGESNTIRIGDPAIHHRHLLPEFQPVASQRFCSITTTAP